MKMKINDKSLIAFANCSSHIDREGWLMKRGEVNKAFQRRWFILKGNMLFYFEKKGDREPIGVIILEGCTVELAESKDMYSFELVFPGAGSRTYIMAAETQEEMEVWMKAIACAGYDYMKLMVSELQRQLDELNMDSGRHGSGGSASTQNTQLVDVSHGKTRKNSGPAPPRFNPFNNSMTNAELDLFGQTPFQPELVAVQDTNDRKTGREGMCVKAGRSFDEMHEAFGQYILLKQQDWQKDLIAEACSTDA